MSLVILAGMGLGGLALLWLTQTLALRAAGDAHLFAWPLRHDSDSALVRWALKLALQAVLLGLILFPWVVGEDPLAYHRAKLEPAQWGVLVRTLLATVLAFSLLLLVNVLGGWVRLTRLYGWSRSVSKVARGSLTPLPLAFMEEALFRGVVFEQLLRAAPADTAGRCLALGLSAALFSALHFLRPQKRTLLPALGLFALGCTLGLAYLAGGHTYWLPVAIHAGGVWFIQVTRPFVTYNGPPWLIGYRTYPICGALGLAVMALLTVWAVR
jgi:hypothetical protein